MYKKIKEIVVFAVILFMLIGTVSAAMVTNTHAHRSAKHKDTSIFSSEIERSELGILSKEKVSSAKRTSSFSQKVKYKPRKWRKYRLKWKFKKHKRQKKHRVKDGRKVPKQAFLGLLKYFGSLIFLIMFAFPQSVIVLILAITLYIFLSVLGLWLDFKALKTIKNEPTKYKGKNFVLVSIIVWIVYFILRALLILVVFS